MPPLAPKSFSLSDVFPPPASAVSLISVGSSYRFMVPSTISTRTGGSCKSAVTNIELRKSVWFQVWFHNICMCPYCNPPLVSMASLHTCSWDAFEPSPPEWKIGLSPASCRIADPKKYNSSPGMLIGGIGHCETSWKAESRNLSGYTVSLIPPSGSTHFCSRWAFLN